MFARGTTLMAAPFDLERLEVTGDPVALLEGITRTGASTAEYWLSENGTLVYRPGTSLAGGWTLAWVGRDGGEEVLAMEPRTTGTRACRRMGDASPRMLLEISGSMIWLVARLRA